MAQQSTATQTAIRDLYESRQNRETHPQGSFDSAGRFYLSDSERCACCNTIRIPSRAWPYSEMLHGRTRKHIANLLAKRAGEAQ